MRSPDRTPEARETSLVVFTVGTVRYASRIQEVREVCAPMDLTLLPHLPLGVAGVCYHRGEVVPIVDLRSVFGLAKSEQPKRAKWVFVQVAERAVGLVVDDVAGVVHVDSGSFRSPPALGPADRSRAIASVTTHDEQLLFVMDVSQFEQLASEVDRTTLPPPSTGGPS